MLSEKLKRKDYEISTLKRQLCEQQRQLDDLRQNLRQLTHRNDDQQHGTVWVVQMWLGGGVELTIKHKLNYFDKLHLFRCSTLRDILELTHSKNLLKMLNLDISLLY